VESQAKEGYEQEVCQAQHQGDHHILCYGDNLTFGFCSNGNQCKPYAAALSEGLANAGIRCKVSVGGLSGHTARQMVAAAENPSVKDAQGRHIGRGLGRILDEDGPFDLVIIMAGTNDLTLLSRSEDILREIRHLHLHAHKRSVPTVALAPPSPQREGQLEVAKLLAQWVQTAQPVLGYASVEEFIPRSARGFWEPDNVHLSPAGSAALGQRMMVHLLPVLSYLGWGEAASKAARELALQQERQKAASGACGAKASYAEPGEPQMSIAGVSHAPQLSINTSWPQRLGA
jgi:lysophospholipase L1-like esterase